MSRGHLVVDYHYCLWVPWWGEQEWLGCRLLIIVSVPCEQEPLGCRLIVLSWEQGAQSRSYQWSAFVFRHHMRQGHQVQFDLSSLWSLRRSQQYLASFDIYVDSRLFAIFYSVFLASLMIISYALVLLWLRVGLPFHSFLMAGFDGFSLTFAGLILWYVCNLSVLSLLSK